MHCKVTVCLSAFTAFERAKDVNVGYTLIF